MESNHSPYQDLAGKTALVTGGTKGIGKAIADKLRQAGAQVIITARQKPEETTSAHQFIEADLTQPAQVAQLAHTIHETVGALDILVDNIGGVTAPGGGFGSLTGAGAAIQLVGYYSAGPRTVTPHAGEEKRGDYSYLVGGRSEARMVS